MKRFPYILCIVFPVFVWACHTSRQTIGEARENRVHSIDRDLHVVIDSLCRNEWSGDRKSTRLNSSHTDSSRMPSSA